MNAFTKAIAAGAAGAGTTTILHELTRRLTPDAPRVDLLGMQALARLLRAGGAVPPTGRALYTLTLAGDLASNTAYFGAVGAGPRERAVALGAALGLVAGAGAVLLPPRLGLSGATTGRTGATAALAVALYTALGLVAGAAYRALPGEGRAGAPTDEAPAGRSRAAGWQGRARGRTRPSRSWRTPTARRSHPRTAVGAGPSGRGPGGRVPVPVVRLAPGGQRRRRPGRDPAGTAGTRRSPTGRSAAGLCSSPTAPHAVVRAGTAVRGGVANAPSVWLAGLRGTVSAALLGTGRARVADDQVLARGPDDFAGDGPQAVDQQDALDLGEEALQQAEVAPRPPRPMQATNAAKRCRNGATYPDSSQEVERLALLSLP